MFFFPFLLLCRTISRITSYLSIWIWLLNLNANYILHVMRHLPLNIFCWMKFTKSYSISCFEATATSPPPPSTSNRCETILFLLKIICLCTICHHPGRLGYVSICKNRFVLNLSILCTIRCGNFDTFQSYARCPGC